VCYGYDREGARFTGHERDFGKRRLIHDALQGLSRMSFKDLVIHQRRFQLNDGHVSDGC
jgi:hypothetical protein